MTARLANAPKILSRVVIKRVWTTRRQKWTTSGAGVAAAGGAFVVPNFGLAAFGTAIAGWWFAVALIAVFGGFMGYHLDQRSELASLKRRLQD